MRILHLSSVFPQPGQPMRGIYNYYLCRALAQRHTVKVVVPWAWWSKLGRFLRTAGRDHLKGLQQAGPDVSYPSFCYLPKLLQNQHDWFMWQSVKSSVLASCRDSKPELILSYWTHPDGGAAVRAGRVMGVPVALRVGGSDVLLELKKPSRRQAFLDVLQNVDLLLPVGECLQEALVSAGLPEEKIHLLREGVDRDRFAPGDKRQARRCLNLPCEKPLLLWVGNMVPVKGLKILVQACQLLKAGGTDFCLALIGAGPLERELMAEVKVRKLADSVYFAGVVAHDQLPHWYRSAELTVLPSFSEGIPNVLRESLACGTPFVASRVGGIADMATEPLDRLVAPGDPVALAAAIQEKLTSPECSARRAFVPGSWEDMACDLTDAVASLLARQHRTSVVP